MVDETTPVAFMSYTHHDDEHGRGNITAFRKALEGEVRAQTGRHDVEIFQDRDDIAWGQAWKERIDDSLDAAAFVVPVLTPSFFNSPQCRRELRRFLDRERRLGRKDLVLPVYWIETPALEDPALRNSDDLAAELAARQYTDWRELRFQDVGQPETRRALARLATHIRDAVGPAGRDRRSADAVRDNVIQVARRAVSAVGAGDCDAVGLVNTLVDAVRDAPWLSEDEVCSLRRVAQSRLDRAPGALRASTSTPVEAPGGVEPAEVDGFQSRARAVVEGAVASTVTAAGDSAVAGRLVDAVREICVLSDPARAGGGAAAVEVLRAAVEARLGVLRESAGQATRESGAGVGTARRGREKAAGRLRPAVHPSAGRAVPRAVAEAGNPPAVAGRPRPPASTPGTPGVQAPATGCRGAVRASSGRPCLGRTGLPPAGGGTTGRMTVPLFRRAPSGDWPRG
jgi:hypothetical protein